MLESHINTKCYNCCNVFFYIYFKVKNWNHISQSERGLSLRESFLKSVLEKSSGSPIQCLKDATAHWKGFERGRVNNLVSPLKRLAGRNHDDHQLPFPFCLQIGKTRVQRENGPSKVTMKVNGISCCRTQVSRRLVHQTIYST